MARGVDLGILLLCLLQAEHVCCLWAIQAQSSQRQNGNTYVGFSQQDSGLGRLGGSYPQNQLRQASAQGSSFNTEGAVSSGYSQGLSSSGYTQTLSKPPQSGQPSVRFVQSKSLSKPNWQATSSQVSVSNVPKRFSGLSTSIASGSSLSKYSKSQNDFTDLSKKSAWPVQQGTPRASKYLSSSSASVQSPPGKSKLAFHQSAALKAPGAAAGTSAYYGQTGSSPMGSSSLFSAGAPVPQKNSVRMQTSASAPARRVSKASKSPPFSNPQKERSRTNPSQKEARKVHSKLFLVNGGKAQGSNIPASTSYSQSLPVSKQNAHVKFQPRSPENTSQRLSYKSSYSTEPIPSSKGSLQASWNSGKTAQGARNLPASRSSNAGTSAQHFAPTRIHNIPERYGGYAIRRLKDPADRKEASVRKPQQTYTPLPPQQHASYKPQVQSAHQASKWKRVEPQWGY